MSRAVTVGLDQRFRSQSRRTSSRGEVRCPGSGLGAGPSANENAVYRQSISDSWLGNFKRMSGSSGLKVQAAIAC